MFLYIHVNFFSLPVVHVTNKGNFLFLKEFGKQFGISFFVKYEIKVSKVYTHKSFKSGEFGSSIFDEEFIYWYKLKYFIIIYIILDLW